VAEARKMMGVEQASRSSSGFWLFLYMRSQWEKLKIGVK
jgi:hypothetical protein